MEEEDLVNITVKGACCRALTTAFGILLVAGGLQASTLWNNGAVADVSVSANNVCDSICGKTTPNPFTIFDNFTVGSTGWNVTGFDFTDFLVNTPTGNYGSTKWSIWSGDPVNGGGSLLAIGTATASLANVSGICGATSTCLETFTVNLGTTVTLAAGTTYFLGTYNVWQNTTDQSYRATAFGHSPSVFSGVGALQGWEQSNGTNGALNTPWLAPTAGPNAVNNNYPSVSAGVSATDTAFDITGQLNTPEPGTLTMLSIAFAGLGFFLRRRSA